MVKAAGGHSKNKDKYQGWLRSSLFWHGPLICAAVSSPGFILFRNKKKNVKYDFLEFYQMESGSNSGNQRLWEKTWKKQSVGSPFSIREWG